MGNINKMYGQLDTIHWLPPMFVMYYFETQNQHLYLSTPVVEPFEVSVFDGGRKLLKKVLLSKSTSQILSFYADQISDSLFIKEVYYKLLVGVHDANKVFSDKGLIFQADHEFYVNYRVEEKSHAGSLTTKGRSSLGTDFRIGHIFTLGDINRTNFFSLMSSVDNTTVTISDFDDGITPRGFSGPINPPITISLPNAGNSYILALSANGQNENGLLGALVHSDYPIIVTSGSWVSSPNFQAYADIGIDQIIPIDKVGTEYVLVRGGGPDILETPIVVAHKDNTLVYVNGNNVPITLINSGEYFVIPASEYSTGGNMYIHLSESGYVYQSLGGTMAPETGGFNIIPPLTCLANNSLDYIPNISEIGSLQSEGALFIVSQTGTMMEINDGAIPSGAPIPVTGNMDYETYKIYGITGNVKVESSGPLQVGYFGYNGNSGWSALYTGLPIQVYPDFLLTGISGCPDTLILNTTIEGEYNWYLNDSLISVSEDKSLIASNSGAYRVSIVVGDCDESKELYSNIVYSEKSPEIKILSIEINPENCDLKNGTIQINANGGITPLSYTLDNGISQISNVFKDLSAGEYTIKVTDIKGCLLEVSVTISEIPPPRIDSVVISPSFCRLSNGTVNVYASDGTGQLEYSLINDLNQTSPLFLNVVPGNYNLNVMDDVGCIVSENVEMLQISMYDIESIDIQQVSCGEQNGRIAFQLVNADSSLQISLNEGIPHSTQTFDGLGASSYHFSLSDGNGCRMDTTLTLTYIDCPLFIPNVFSPNGDGVNDRFIVSPHPDFEFVTCSFTIYDRWGGILFYSTFLPKDEISWNGIVKNGTTALVGVYTYMLKLVSVGIPDANYSGSVTIVK